MLKARIVPRTRDLGDGFTVRRSLPSAEARSVGPFVFFDQMGPVVLRDGRALDVRPHPHIGLATVTYLFSGEIMHRDSLGTEALIRPGEVNWMTAGSGIVHSERTPQALRRRDSELFGLQTWLAVPREHEEDAPSFVHRDRLPVIEEPGLSIRVILGRLGGITSPVATLSPTIYAEAMLAQGTRLALPDEIVERAVHVVDGSIEIDGTVHGAGELLVFEPRTAVAIAAISQARVMLLGGDPLDGPRFVWWNFVSSRKERIRDAAEDWKAQRFPRVPGETELIPLPERGPGIVDYP